MRKRLRLSLALLLLASFVLGAGPIPQNVASAQSPVTLKVFNPTGAFEVSQTFAPRVADLNGATVCEITNDDWEANRTFPVIRDLLQKQFPTVKIIAYDQFPTLLLGSDVPGLEDAIKAKGCQAAILGNAG